MAVVVPVWLSCISPLPALGLYQPSLYVGSVMEFSPHACAASPPSTGLPPQHRLSDTTAQKVKVSLTIANTHSTLNNTRLLSRTGNTVTKAE